MDSITQIATTSIASVWTFVLSFLALILLAGALYGWAWKSGRDVLVSFIFSLYAGYAIYFIFPYSDDIIKAGGSALNALVLRVLFLAVFTGISYWAIRKHSGSGYFRGGEIGTIILAILTSGFILAILYHSLNAKSAYAFTSSLDALFVPKEYFFWWFVAPLIGVLGLSR
jgi:hypothetical protein